MERFSRTQDKLDKLPVLWENSNKFQMYRQKPAAVCKKENIYDRPAKPMERVSKCYNKSTYNLHEEPFYETTIKELDFKGLQGKAAQLSKRENAFSNRNASVNTSAPGSEKKYKLPPIPPVVKKPPAYVKLAENMDLSTSQNACKLPKIQHTGSNKVKCLTTAEPFNAGSTVNEVLDVWSYKEPFYETTIKELDFKGLQGKAAQLSKRENAFSNRNASVNTSAPGSEKKYKLPPIPPVVQKPPAYVKHAENMDLSSTSQNGCKLPKIQHTGSNKEKCLTTAEPFNAGSTLNEVLNVWSYKRPVLMGKKGTTPANPSQKKTPFKLVIVPQPPLYLENKF